jgi:hypothetical protein
VRVAGHKTVDKKLGNQDPSDWSDSRTVLSLLLKVGDKC